MRSEDDRSGPARRLGGEVLPARRAGLQGHRGLSMSMVDERLEEVSPSRVSRRTAVIRVVIGLVATGIVVGAVWAWLAPPIQAVVALTRSGDRIRGYLGDESDH